jgi:hypothetical protein
MRMLTNGGHKISLLQFSFSLFFNSPKYIQVNSNGIRIAQDKEYLSRLKEAGATIIYLQFDGVSDDVYRTL